MLVVLFGDSPPRRPRPQSGVGGLTLPNNLWFVLAVNLVVTLVAVAPLYRERAWRALRELYGEHEGRFRQFGSFLAILAVLALFTSIVKFGYFVLDVLSAIATASAAAAPAVVKFFVLAVFGAVLIYVLYAKTPILRQALAPAVPAFRKVRELWLPTCSGLAPPSDPRPLPQRLVLPQEPVVRDEPSPPCPIAPRVSLPTSPPAAAVASRRRPRRRYSI